MPQHQRVDMTCSLRINSTAGVRFGDEETRAKWLKRCEEMRATMRPGEYRVAPLVSLPSRRGPLLGEGTPITVDDMLDPRRAQGDLEELVLKGYVITA